MVTPTMFFTLGETASCLKTSVNSVKTAIDRRKLRAVRINGSVRVWARDVLALLGEPAIGFEFPDGVATDADIARVLKWKAGTVRKYVQSGLLPGFKVGSRTRIRWSDLAAFLEQAAIVPDGEEVPLG